MLLYRTIMPRVTIKLFASLRDGRFSVDTVEFERSPSVVDVIRYLRISQKEAALILVNSRHADLSTALNDGDTLAIFPPVGGG